MRKNKYALLIRALKKEFESFITSNRKQLLQVFAAKGGSTSLYAYTKGCRLSSTLLYHQQTCVPDTND